MNDLPESTLIWPAEKFFWAVLDSKALPAATRHRRAAWEFLLEPHLPIPLEAVHAVFEEASEDRLVACVLPQAVLGELSDWVDSLVPESVPAFLNVDLAPECFDLRSGPYSSPRIRKARRRRWSMAASWVVLSVLMFVLGSELRISRLRSKTGSLHESTLAMLLEALGPQARAAPLPPDMVLEAELRRLKQTRIRDETAAPPRNAAFDLARWMSAWPQAQGDRLESLIVTEDGVHVRESFLDAEAADRFLVAAPVVEGWSRKLPSVQSSERVVSVALQWEREKPP